MRNRAKTLSTTEARQADGRVDTKYILYASSALAAVALGAAALFLHG